MVSGAGSGVVPEVGSGVEPFLDSSPVGVFARLSVWVCLAVGADVLRRGVCLGTACLGTVCLDAGGVVSRSPSLVCDGTAVGDVVSRTVG
ncbi:hypothetical protein H4W81_006682 [Nonomuraea africana]|uniref:Uncharacterized protein n=1 Tax=Nonomuraea africana TaxID=46171 RepID=A0ABR9KPF2_9ACTN|nr:hypothetical protein [Nonomuraea africana]